MIANTYTFLFMASSFSEALLLLCHQAFQKLCSAAMSSRLSPEFVAAFTELINQEMSISANEFYQKGMAILKEHKLLRYVVKQLPKFFLTHKENRNRLMLNARNVHVKGAVIYAIGADLQQLSTAVCVELAQEAVSDRDLTVPTDKTM